MEAPSHSRELGFGFVCLEGYGLSLVEAKIALVIANRKEPLRDVTELSRRHESNTRMEARAKPKEL